LGKTVSKAILNKDPNGRSVDQKPQGRDDIDRTLRHGPSGAGCHMTRGGMYRRTGKASGLPTRHPVTRKKTGARKAGDRDMVNML